MVIDYLRNRFEYNALFWIKVYGNMVQVGFDTCNVENGEEISVIRQ